MAHAELLRNPRRHAVQPQRGFPEGRLATSKSCQVTRVSSRCRWLHARFLGRKPRRKALEAVRFALHVSDLDGV